MPSSLRSRALPSMAGLPTAGPSLASTTVLILLLFLACLRPALAETAGAATGRLEGHVLPIPAGAGWGEVKSAESEGSARPILLTVVLRRSDADGFERYLADVYDPASARYRQFLTPIQVADRFGPAASDYAEVRRHFEGQGFAVVEDSANRTTLTLSAPRGLVEHALDVTLKDYRSADGRTVFATTRDPSLPAAIANRVQAIAGLSTLALAQRPSQPLFIANWGNGCSNNSSLDPYTRAFCYGVYSNALGVHNGVCSNWLGILLTLFLCKTVPIGPPPPMHDGIGLAHSTGSDPLPGAGQNVGIVAFDSFDPSDVSDFLALIGAPAGQIAQLGSVAVAGGTAIGPNEDEVLLDIDTIMAIAPGAGVTVYSTALHGGASYQALFSRMIDDGVSVISNSWSYCEDQTSAADAQSIDAILAGAAASGISVLNAAGDSGSTCLDGSANTIGVPANAPHGTAVGGTSSHTGPGDTYASETWWDGSQSTPRTGQGGFGVSRYFTRPDYQSGYTTSTMRSIPDVAVNADPAANGVPICRADAGGCPNGLVYGGTSHSAPLMAAFVATLNQASGANLGWLNPSFYAHGNSGAFHSPASMGSDFAHVGLGSPNLSLLALALSGGTLGAPDAANSLLVADPPQSPADGSTAAHVVVQLRDASGYTVGGKTVTLSAAPGSHAIVTPTSAITRMENGAAVFAVTDATIENVVFSARDVSDNLALSATIAIDFVSPPAAAGGIFAFPTSVAADGFSTTTITITLRDADDQPTPGKHVSIAQNGRSVVAGPNPPVTDANGEIAFTATDVFEETVTYTAIDETDGDLPVPGTAIVSFGGSAAGSCVAQPVPLGDYVLTPFVNGFSAYSFFYGNTNFGCSGAGDPAFDTLGNAYIAHIPTGNLYRLGPDGGSATTPLSSLGPTLHQPLFDSAGRLYAAHSVTTGNFTTGDIVEIDPVTGAQLRVVAANLTCPNGLALDPLSGDLFFDDSCTGAGSDNPSVFRLADPSGTDPDRPTEVTVYATLPGTPNGILSFAPDGTLFAATVYGDCQHSPLFAISATDGPSPPTVTMLTNTDSCYWVRVGAVDENGAARSLLVENPSPSGGFFLDLVDITTTPATQTPLAQNLGSGTVGADGCLYATSLDTVYKLTPPSGVCEFATTNPSPALDLSPRTVAPNPVQGTSQTITAAFRYVAVPDGTPVHFQISGANAQIRLVRTADNGTATLDYQGAASGDDVIVASALVDGQTLVSNPARVSWNAGAHTSYLAIGGALTARIGIATPLAATLTDVSIDPQAAIGGATISFTVGSRSCSAATAASGVATCNVTLEQPGIYTLTATYAGSASYLTSSRSVLFSVPNDDIDEIFKDGFDGAP